VRQLGTDVVVEWLEATRLEPLDVLVERVDERTERQLSLEFGCRPGENQLPTHGSASPKLFE
jgi:hypothetical protein